MTLSLGCRRAALSGALAALCSAVPLSAKLTADGLSPGGSAAAQEMPDDPYAPPGGGPGPSDPGPSDPGDTGTHFEPDPEPEAAAPETAEKPKADAQAVASERTADRGGKNDDSPTGSGMSTKSTPATEPVTGQKTAREEAREFAEDLECRSACTAKIKSDGDVEVSIASKTTEGQDVETTVKLDDKTVTTKVAVDEKPVAEAEQTFETQEEAQTQVADITRSLEASLRISYTSWGEFIGDPGNIDAGSEAFAKAMSDMLDLSFIPAPVFD